jgi:hypothetical protein
MGDLSPCTAEDGVGSIQAILHMSSLCGKQELRDSTEGTVAGVRFSFLPHSKMYGCCGNCVARYGVVGGGGTVHNMSLAYGHHVATLLGAFAKLREATVTSVVSLSVCPSVCPHGMSRLPLDGFS